MGRLGRHAVELEHLEPAAGAELRGARRAQVEATEAESGEALHQAVEACRERRAGELPAVAEDRAPAVVADLDQLNPLPRSGDPVQPRSIGREVGRGHADRALVGEDQLVDRVLAVPGERRELLDRDREDPPPRCARRAGVEDSELLAGDVLLDDEVVRRVLEVVRQLSRRADHRHAASALADVGLEHHRIVEPRLGHRTLDRRAAPGDRAFERQATKARHLLAVAEAGEDRALRLFDEPTAGNPRIGRREEGEVAVPNAQPEDRKHHRNLEQPGGPELPVPPTPPASQEEPAPPPAEEGDHEMDHDEGQSGSGQQEGQREALEFGEAPQQGAARPRCEPDQEGRPDESGREQGDRHARKGSAQDSGGEEERQPAARDEPGEEHHLDALAGEPVFAPLQGFGLEEPADRRPVDDPRAEESSRQDEQEITDEDAGETGDSGREKGEDPARDEEAGGDAGQVLARQRRQREQDAQEELPAGSTRRRRIGGTVHPLQRAQQLVGQSVGAVRRGRGGLRPNRSRRLTRRLRRLRKRLGRPGERAGQGQGEARQGPVAEHGHGARRGSRGRHDPLRCGARSSARRRGGPAAASWSML